MSHRLTLALFLLAIVPAARADDAFFLRDGRRVVFLGDSNTFAGHFVAYLDGYLFTRFPDKRFELINLGLPSETVSGLSEEDHPWPRPDVHERLARALAKTKPDVVVACYGMNDGIYHPFAEGRLKAYQDGTLRLVGEVRKVGATVVLMTPSPFDARAVPAKLQPLSAGRFSYLKPFADYDAVLGRYGDWLLTLRDQGIPVVDARAGLVRHLETVRASDPNYVLSGDGIHPSPAGHWLVTQALLRAWEAPADVDEVEIDLKTSKAVRGRVSGLTAKDGRIAFVWETKVPMPTDPRWDRRLAEGERIAERLNRHRLKVTGVAPGRHALSEGERRVGTFTEKELADGVDLTALPELTTNRRAAEVGKLVARRERLLALAWLTEVGHKRPDTPKGRPLAEARDQAAELEKRIRALAVPPELALRLEAVVPGGVP